MKRFTYSALAAVVFAASAFTLKSDVAHEEKTIDTFKSGEYGHFSWWGSSAIKKVGVVDEAIKYEVTNAGDPATDGGYSTFGRDHSVETIDFTEWKVLKLKVKVDAESDMKLRCTLKDIDDLQNNAKPLVKTIKATGEYQDVYFDFSNDDFAQSWPTAAKADPEEIKELLFFVNPGGPKWSGTFFIDEVSLLTEMP